ncbi:hypothetical protein ACFPRL_11095 [Pseudoclavibacter helvolus]
MISRGEWSCRLGGCRGRGVWRVAARRAGPGPASSRMPRRSPAGAPRRGGRNDGRARP